MASGRYFFRVMMALFKPTGNDLLLAVWQQDGICGSGGQMDGIGAKDAARQRHDDWGIVFYDHSHSVTHAPTMVDHDRNFVLLIAKIILLIWVAWGLIYISEQIAGPVFDFGVVAGY